MKKGAKAQRHKGRKTQKEIQNLDADFADFADFNFFQRNQRNLPPNSFFFVFIAVKSAPAKRKNKRAGRQASPFD